MKQRSNCCAARRRPSNRRTGGVLAHVFALAGAALLCAALCLPALSFSTGPGFAVVYPIVRPQITSTYGMRNHPIFHVRRHHNGVDLCAPIGTPIRAISGGQVIFADPYAGYGNLIVVRHPSGVTSHYGHLLKIKVTPGTKVKAGQIIGLLGSTGSSTGPHLHLEIRNGGQALDPMRIIPGLRAEAEG